MDRGKCDGNYKIWIINTLIFIIVVFVFIASITIYIDPLFHYHAPLDNFSYRINDERYQNDGITRHFEYNSIITGTSMAANFKTSEADKIFNSNFIKVTYVGGYYKEINDNLRRAYDAGKDVKNIIRSLDISVLIMDKDSYNKERLDGNFPTYLYNDNIFDDVNYVLNKSILSQFVLGGTIKYTMDGNKTTNFDDYANWQKSKGRSFNYNAVLKEYNFALPQVLAKNEENIILENIKQNITDLADEHPETTFYLFFPPYSICYWYELNNKGQVNYYIDAISLAIKEIIKHPNIKLYGFNSNFELICDFKNNYYIDSRHYGESVNSWMLEKMYNEEYLLTADNYREYIDAIREFYNSYDYEALHKLEN